jgi:hypothetical protein
MSVKSPGLPTGLANVANTFTALQKFNPGTAECLRLIAADSAGDCFMSFYSSDGTTFRAYIGNGSTTTNTFDISNLANADMDFYTNSIKRLNLTAAGALNIIGTVGFNNTPAIAKPTVTGAKGSNAALASLLTALAAYGLVIDSTTA